VGFVVLARHFSRCLGGVSGSSSGMLRKSLLAALLSAATALAGEVTDHLGLQLYSLRAMRSEGLVAVLDKTKSLGFASLEGGSPKELTILQYKAELAARGLSMPSMGFSYERLEADLASAVNQAKALGVSFVMVAWIPHDDKAGFTAGEEAKAAADFNRWGEAFRAAGITFAYHPHGYEFKPLADGTTLFDALVAATRPADVSFEMDVFWVTHAGQDPVKLLARYPDRWRMMHIKDIRKGAPTGIYTGHAPAADDVAVGTGQVDWPSVLSEARKVGVRWYFIEDESDSPLVNIPASLAYLKSLGL
jgi:sugar phosphate isomerase/epimerase